MTIKEDNNPIFEELRELAQSTEKSIGYNPTISSLIFIANKLLSNAQLDSDVEKNLLLKICFNFFTLQLPNSNQKIHADWKNLWGKIKPLVIETVPFKEFYDLYSTQTNLYNDLTKKQKELEKESQKKSKNKKLDKTPLEDNATIANLKMIVDGMSDVLIEMTDKTLKTYQKIIKEKYSGVVSAYSTAQKQRQMISQQINDLQKNLYHIEYVKREQWEIDNERHEREDYNDFSEPSHYKEVKHEKPEIAARILELKAALARASYAFPPNLPSWVKFYAENIDEKKQISSATVYELNVAYQKSVISASDAKNNVLSKAEPENENKSALDTSKPQAVNTILSPLEKINKITAFIKSHPSYHNALEKAEESKMVVAELTKKLNKLRGQLHQQKWVDKPEHEIREERERLEDYNDFSEPAHQKLVTIKDEIVAEFISNHEREISRRQIITFDKNTPEWVITFISNYAGLNHIPVNFDSIKLDAIYDKAFSEKFVASNNDYEVSNNNAAAMPVPSAPPLPPDEQPVLIEANKEILKDNKALYIKLQKLAAINKVEIDEILIDVDSENLVCATLETLMLEPSFIAADGGINYICEKSVFTTILEKNINESRHPYTNIAFNAADIKPAVAVHKRVTSYLENKIAEQEILLEKANQKPISNEEKSNNNAVESTTALARKVDSSTAMLGTMLKNYKQSNEIKKEDVGNNLNNNAQPVKQVPQVSKADLLKQLDNIKVPDEKPSVLIDPTNSGVLKKPESKQNNIIGNDNNEQVAEEKPKKNKRAQLN